MKTKENEEKTIPFIKRKVRLCLRDEFWSNWFWAFLACAGVGIILWIVILCTQNSEGAWVSILKAGSPFPCREKFPLGAHIFLGILNTIIIAPIIIAAVTTSIQHRIKRILIGEKRYNHLKGHYVLIGYNKYSASIINNRLGREKDKLSTLVLLTSINPKIIRAELRSLLPQFIEERVIIYAGNPQSDDQIKSLRLPYAKAVYVTLDGDEWNSPYARNISIIQSISKFAGEREENDHLPVNVLINDDRAYDLAQALELPNTCHSYNGYRNLDIHIYNFYENWARLLWSYSGKKDDKGNYYYSDLDFEPLEGTDKYVHLVIVGFNSMGKALLKEAVRLCHYPNYDAKRVIGKTQITIIDPLADTLQSDFEASYPNLSQIKDIDITFKKARIEDKVIRTDIEKWAQDKKQLLTIAVCLDDPDTAMQKALSLPEAIYVDYEQLELKPKENDPYRATVIKNNTRPRVLVRQSVCSSIQDIINANAKHYANLKIFGTYYDGLAVNLLNDNLAVCVNGLYADHIYDDLKKISIIEELPIKEKYEKWRKNWYLLTENERCNNRYQIDMYRSIFAYLKRKEIPIGHILTDKKPIELLAEVEHRRWIADKSLYGFRQKIGEELRVDDVKIHNCIDDYAKLSPVDQQKDYAIVISAPVLVSWENEVGETL